MKVIFSAITRLAQGLNAHLGKSWRRQAKPVVARARPYWHRIKFLLNCFKFESFGPRCSLAGPVKVLGTPCITLGSHVAFRSHIVIGGNGQLQIDDHAVINDFCMISAFERIAIGKHVMLAPFVYVLDIDHDFSDPSQPVSRQGYKKAAVTIEDGVWIGTQSVVTRGVTIGKNSVIAANSVVTRDIPPNSIAAGSPAVVIRQR